MLVLEIGRRLLCRRRQCRKITRPPLLDAQKGDFIYLDPPYQPLNNTSYFTARSTDGFDDRDQSELANVFRKLSDRGCFVLLSNSDTPFIRKLYSDFSIKEVGVQRAINCKGFFSQVSRSC
jgi:DNA adenine methylase